MPKKTEPEEKRKLNARILSVKEGSAYSVSDAMGMRYITPYALYLGANNTHIGFLSSVPQLIGSFSQLYALKLLGKFSRKNLVFLGALFQAVMWLVLIALGFLYYSSQISSSSASLLLIIFYTILISFGLSISPIWNSWMKDIVPENKLGIYFGIRNRILGFVILISLLFAGFILDLFKSKVFIGFAIIFSIAFIARIISSLMFIKKYEPEYIHIESNLTLRKFLKDIHKDNFGRFVFYVAFIIFATYISSPFFSVYMLKNLSFNYVSYTLVIMSSIITTIIFMPVWGKFADIYGNVKVIKITGYLVPLVPLFWLLSPFIHLYFPDLTILYLILTEMFAGFAWAGFNLASANFIFASSTKETLTKYVAYFNILYHFGVFFGSIAGGIFATILQGNIAFIEPLLIVFFISLILRFSASVIMIPRIKEILKVKEFSTKTAVNIVQHLSAERIFRIFR